MQPTENTPIHRRVEPLPSWRKPLDAAARRRECMLGGLFLLMLAGALIGPAVAQPSHYHAFADQRGWGMLSHAMDVLSNLPFVLWGAAGLWALLRAMRVQAVSGVAAGLAALIFSGLVMTAMVSAAYHFRPDDAGLAWDRGGMVFAFAGLLGLAALRAVSARAGVALALAVLALGPLSVYSWSLSGNVLPWAVLQFGGMLLVVWFAWLPPVRSGRAWPVLPVRWMMVIAIYALAKLLELGDHAVYEWTGHLVSGHSLKHVVASFAAWPVVSALLAARKIKAESSAPSTRAGRFAKARRTTTETRGQA
jgi:hypothetical protein